ncbi:hypothetical protein IAR50_007270 [Cryptococcus sp. DSM 104548]
MSKPASVTTLDASEPLERIFEVIARDGAVIIANFLPAELLNEYLTGIEPYFEERDIYTSSSADSELGADFFPNMSKRVYGLLGKVPKAISGTMKLPLWQAIMDKFLSDEFSSYTGHNLLPQKSSFMLGSTAAMRLVPGANAQPLHRDQMPYLVRQDPENPLFTPMIGCLIAGSKCTAKNGATMCIPGSHLWPGDRAPNVEEAVPAEMDPGSALITLGNTYHGAGKNQCDPSDPDALRTIFSCFGQRDYFRQDQEEILSTPIEVVKTLDEETLRLAGFFKSKGGVGYVENHEDPIQYLNTNHLLGRYTTLAGSILA